MHNPSRESLSYSSPIHKDQEAHLKTTNQAIEEILKFSFPVWPLQNTVAVNPFWSLRDQPYEEVMGKISSITATPLFMSSEMYLEKIGTGEISEEVLSEVLTETRTRWPGLPDHAQGLKDHLSCHETQNSLNRIKSFGEYFDPSSFWHSKIISEVSKFAAAYLDQGQAIAAFPLKNKSFFSAWQSLIHDDKTLESWGLSFDKQVLRTFDGLEASEAISRMLNDIGIRGETTQKEYLGVLLFSVLGWSTQFSYHLWQQQLGYKKTSEGTPTDLLAVRLAYDYLLFKSALVSDHNIAKLWLKDLEEQTSARQNLTSPALSQELQLSYVCQLAWERTYQRSLSIGLNRKLKFIQKTPQVQMVFCIDVRSEMLRRHIETTDPKIETLGFAGFFGLPLDYVCTDEKQAQHRLPVLLSPALKVHEQNQSPENRDDQNPDLKQTLIQNYFRNLRKGTLSSLTYVELFGAFYIEKMISQSLNYIREVFQTDHIPQRFCDSRKKVSLSQVFSNQAEPLSINSHVTRVAGILNHLGLTSEFSELIFIVGHGSETTNNSFGSSLDCGACGGHAGDVNAKFLVALLNSPIIRKGLKEASIDIPDSTWFVAAVHETVTDEIFILDRSDIPEQFQSKIQTLEKNLKQASKNCQNERQTARSKRSSVDPMKRAKNWSEVRPEWALAGNAAFIVAPRERTYGVNLNSRVFLHNYDWMKDEKRGFQTLELIMTAPMIVTSWINLQYYASTVAPQIYSSGNKVLHNLVNESGVFEGNGGDLRVGLPLQSLHDGHRWIHDPLRLSVFIEAPKDSIESVIKKHKVVKDLLSNEWLHIIQIDSSQHSFFRRTRHGNYTSI
jgi:uncharacterized protein YbcC (UPF0753/DUF2309 family)